MRLSVRLVPSQALSAASRSLCVVLIPAFAGTGFGLFFSVDAGAHWIKLSGAVPNIPFRDLAIQRRENDLVGATFGRGFYLLDDYAPLRQVSVAALEPYAEWTVPLEELGDRLQIYVELDTSCGYAETNRWETFSYLAPIAMAPQLLVRFIPN